MVLNRIKITNGDLILVTFDGNSWSDYDKDKFSNFLKKWVVSRGLTESDILMVDSATNNNNNAFSINILSVNDVFDETVLK